MKKIKLTQSKVTLVDDEDYELVSQYKWRAMRGTDGRVKSVGRTERLGNKRRTVYLHRVLMGLDYKDGLQVDHKNHNPLDNRRDNLRVCTHAENQRNSLRPKHNTSGYKGVSWHKREKKWHANIGFKGKRYWLGYFMTKEDAYRIYQRKAIELYGEFANNKGGI